MRLVDADKLVTLFDQNEDLCLLKQDKESGKDWRQAKRIVRDAPTHAGAWVQSTKQDHFHGQTGMVCSLCRNAAYWDTDYGQQFFPYCPYCGAKMKKVKQDEL